VKPRIFLLNRPQFDIDAFLSFMTEEGAEWHRSPNARPGEELVEIAGRVCYMSFGNKQSPRSNREYILNLIASGHESVLEHVSWTFLLAGVSRAFTHQLVRHRVGIAFSQLSQQYHEETDAVFVEPEHLQGSPQAMRAWREAISIVQQTYKTVLDSLMRQNASSIGGLDKKEFKRAMYSAARSILPNATETKIVMTANARTLRHIFAVRGTILGDIEMRQVMASLFRLVESEAPALFADFRLTKLPDDTPILEQIRS
jgi:thymidylate synthase (FAD)